MIDVIQTEVGLIGNNGGPPLDPFAAIAAHIEDLNAEARLHLDGNPVSTQEQCDALDKLYDAALVAEKLANDARISEKKPHDDAAAAVQAKWKPLATDAERIKKAARAGTVAWKQHLQAVAAKEAERVANEARIAREAAEAEAKAARDANNLEAIEAAESQLANADILDDMAKKAAKPIATGLRTYWLGEVEDYGAFLKWLKLNRADALKAFLTEELRKEISAGARELSGCKIWSEKR